jgi:transglutaminase-like putative cysteine protease
MMDVAPNSRLVEIQQLPAPILKYLLPSRFCEAELFSQMAGEITNGELPGYNQAASIARWVRENVAYTPGSGLAPVSATVINDRKEGVCRDLAHLAIALCRAICIPARMVVGYLHQLEPMDLHAWFEAYVNDRWYTFDPTQTMLRGGYVPIGFGRDAADVAVYNQFGPPVVPILVRVDVQLTPGATE